MNASEGLRRLALDNNWTGNIVFLLMVVAFVAIPFSAAADKWDVAGFTALVAAFFFIPCWVLGYVLAGFGAKQRGAE